MCEIGCAPLTYTLNTKDKQRKLSQLTKQNQTLIYKLRPGNRVSPVVTTQSPHTTLVCETKLHKTRFCTATANRTSYYKKIPSLPFPDILTKFYKIYDGNTGNLTIRGTFCNNIESTYTHSKDKVVLYSINPFTADPIKALLCHTGLTHHF